MTSIRLSDGIVKDEILVVGLAVKAPKAAKSSSSLQIESGDIALDSKALLQTLADLGATGKADEVIKVPGTSPMIMKFSVAQLVLPHALSLEIPALPFHCLPKMRTLYAQSPKVQVLATISSTNLEALLRALRKRRSRR
jgi:hypothetical protein